MKKAHTRGLLVLFLILDKLVLIKEKKFDKEKKNTKIFNEEYYVLY